MSHFGVICPPVSGHLHPLGALGRELIARGHRVTCFQLRDLESKVQSEGLGFHPIGEDQFPVGSLGQWLAELGRRKGLSALRFTIDAVRRTSEIVCRDAPVAMKAARIDALLVDQLEPAGGAVAEHLGLPFVTICNALPINRDLVAPPPFTPWRYRRGVLARVRNAVGYRVSDGLTRPVSAAVGEFRKISKLPSLPSPDASFSRIAQICQMPGALDFPRVSLPASFHYVGPLRGAPVQPIPFPWDRLDGRPLVYASLGTLQNRREPLFRCFAEACLPLNVQLVISHAGGLSGEEAERLPGAPVVVPYAPQLEVLRRAALTITHAGLNTVLDSLANGVPLVMVPITYEQPAIARRVEWCGAGRSIRLARLQPGRLRDLVTEVLGGSSYRAAAHRMRDAIREAGGVRRAADLVENVLAVGASRPAAGLEAR